MVLRSSCSSQASSGPATSSRSRPRHATRVGVEVAAGSDYEREVALTGTVAARVTSELSFRLDPSNGTVRVKFDIADPPPGMTLGAAVTGFGRFKAERRIVLPWSVLSSRDGKPAVWTVDRASTAVSLRPITVEAYEAERIVVRDGVEAGQMVVARGQQLLRPGQVVDPVEDGAS